MAINLEKGQKINLEKISDGQSTKEKLEKFCVEVSWGAIERIKKGFFGTTKKIIEEVDLDLSCVMTDSRGKYIDHIYSPEYNNFLKSRGIALGKLYSKDESMRHSGDDRGTGVSDDFSEVVSVDMTIVDKEVDQIYFYLNIYLNKDQNFDFSQIPFVKIKMYEGTPAIVKKEHFSFNISTDNSYLGKGAVIMGKLYRRNGDWKFDAIGDAFADKLFLDTQARILRDYASK
ncbi:MAG: TerD family protein [Marinifilaceae bacterium]|jgi:tellurium resistance protein TerZ|nr:TerD family protein [Marinifilaceae bacterium]